MYLTLYLGILNRYKLYRLQIIYPIDSHLLFNRYLAIILTNDMLDPIMLLLILIIDKLILQYKAVSNSTKKIIFIKLLSIMSKMAQIIVITY